MIERANNLAPKVLITTTTNQLFGIITAIQTSAVNAEVLVELKGGEQVVASLALMEFELLELSVGSDVVMLINDPEIFVITDPGNYPLTARNCLRGTVIRIQCDGVESEVVIQLHSGDSLEAPYSVIISY